MKLVYFAWVRARIGCAEEYVDPPESVETVAGLVDWLRARGSGYTAALADTKVVRAAVNQKFVSYDHPIGAHDEVAFFPPVTGG